MKSIGTIGNRLGLYAVTVRTAGWWRRRYWFDCDVCNLASARRRSSAEAWTDGKVHADLHAAIIRDAVGRCVERVSTLGGGTVFCRLRHGHVGMHEAEQELASWPLQWTKAEAAK